MTRARVGLAAALAAVALFAELRIGCQAAQAQQAPQLTPVLAGRKFVPPLKGEAAIEYTAPRTARKGETVVTTIMVKNLMPQPIARLPAPRFDEATLAALDASATSMYCECPSHVVELLRSVSAFERYSAECTSRSPADAELHRYLERVAGTLRTLLEEALERVARAEGLPLVPAPAPGRG